MSRKKPMPGYYDKNIAQNAQKRFFRRGVMIFEGDALSFEGRKETFEVVVERGVLRLCGRAWAMYEAGIEPRNCKVV